MDEILGLKPIHLSNIYDYIVERCPMPDKHPTLRQVMRRFLPDVSHLQGGVYIRYKHGTWSAVELTSKANLALAQRFTASVAVHKDQPKLLWSQIIERVIDDPYDIAQEMHHRWATNNGPVEHVLERFNLTHVENNMDKVLLLYEIPDVKLNDEKQTWYGCDVVPAHEYEQVRRGVSIDTDAVLQRAADDLKDKNFHILQSTKSKLTWSDFTIIQCISDPIWITYFQRDPSVTDLSKFNLLESERKDMVISRRDCLESRPVAPGHVLASFLHLATRARKRPFEAVTGEGEEETKDGDELLSSSSQSSTSSVISATMDSSSDDDEEVAACTRRLPMDSPAQPPFWAADPEHLRLDMSPMSTTSLSDPRRGPGPGSPKV